MRFCTFIETQDNSPNVSLSNANTKALSAPTSKIKREVFIRDNKLQ